MLKITAWILFNSQAAYNQIAYGDIILLNKMDVVDEADADLLEVKLRDIKARCSYFANRPLASAAAADSQCGAV